MWKRHKIQRSWVFFLTIHLLKHYSKFQPAPFLLVNRYTRKPLWNAMFFLDFPENQKFTLDIPNFSARHAEQENAIPQEIPRYFIRKLLFSSLFDKINDIKSQDFFQEWIGKDIAWAIGGGLPDKIRINACTTFLDIFSERNHHKVNKKF